MHCIFPDMDFMSEKEALNKLEGFLKLRIESARKGKFSSRAVEQIFENVRQEQK